MQPPCRRTTEKQLQRECNRSTRTTGFDRRLQRFDDVLRGFDADQTAEEPA